ncbi:hypothetical protein [Plantactinospora sp. KBS50]|uniref:hypothetical protein n=1 Tax=Plantactinospora sp. KBS50 TaxID=2024580 RepID=UPI000BAADCC9|nr:hypothetical protein [Plantactinospora sp. KBS50]ASW53439.1 hypothetical protein CIK06_03435 [Plantactinospora sp. KBS50]
MNVARRLFASGDDYFRNSDFSTWTGDVDREVRRHLDSTYLPLATASVPTDRLATVLDAMRPTGYWTLLGRDVDLVRGLALMGLGTSIGAVQPFLRKRFADHGIDFDAVIPRLLDVASTTGAFRMWYDDDHDEYFCLI